MKPALLILLLLVAPATGVAQPVYKCAGPGGQVVFQQAPCAGSQGGPVDVAPANVVEGRPAGEAFVRAEAERGAAVRSATARGQLLPGMTVAELQQVMGLPVVINTDHFNGSVRQQHVYRGGDGSSRYVYVQDGLVTGLQDRPGLPRAARPGCHPKAEIDAARFELGSVTRTSEEKARIRARLEAMERQRC